MKPEFSIILPVRNGADYIDVAIQSVLAQTYPHFTLVILENCSTDNTRAITDAYAELDERISVVPASEPLSIIDNWTRILELDLHPYMTVLGHDDYYYPDFLSQIAAAIIDNPTASVFTTNFDLVDGAGKVIRHSHQSPFYETAEQFLQQRHHLKRDVSGTGFVVRTANYKNAGGFPPFGRLIYADEYIWYHLSIPGGKVCLPERQFVWRFHNASASKTVQLKELYDATKQYMNVLAKTPYYANIENRKLVRNYVSYRFVGLRHKVLFGLIRFGGPDDWANYEMEKASIMDDNRQHDLFAVYDLPSWLYEQVGLVKWRAIQRPLLYICAVVRLGFRFLQWLKVRQLFS
jgi:glycosyltransferase involved in cell wall biosynthesis